VTEPVHNHRSLEAEIREIPKDAVSAKRGLKTTKPSQSEIKLGSELAALRRHFGGNDLKID
jgi:plasmid stability protein